MSDLVRAAVVQMDVAIGENAANLERVLVKLNEAAANGAKLIVFPECALSGYCFKTLDEGMPFTDVAGNVLLKAFADRCRELGLTGVIGFLEASGAKACNSALVAGAGDEAVYRKTHLPTLGIDRFVTPGDSLEVHETPWGKLGVLICYDVRFPETSRCLSLLGADVIALPTNWPEGAQSTPDFITRSRAWENRVWLLAANRVGVERGRRFIGRSQIVSPAGQIMAEAGAEEETILYHDLDIAFARQKTITFEPGEWEIDVTRDRRPELYGRLLER